MTGPRIAQFSSPPTGGVVSSAVKPGQSRRTPSKCSGCGCIRIHHRAEGPCLCGRCKEWRGATSWRMPDRDRARFDRPGLQWMRPGL